MAALEMLYGEPSWVRLVLGTYTAGQTQEIATLGTKMDILRAIKVVPTFQGASSSSEKPTYHTTDGANGNQYSVPDVSKNYNVLDGTEITEDTTDNATSKFEISVFLTPAQRSSLLAANEDGLPVIAIREIGENTTTQAVAGYEYILGKVTDFKETPGKGPSQYDFTVVGVTTFTIKETTPSTPDIDETDINTLATGSSNKIQPDNETERTITALTSGDWTRLLTGKIVTKNVA